MDIGNIISSRIGKSWSYNFLEIHRKINKVCAQPDQNASIRVIVVY